MNDKGGWSKRPTIKYHVLLTLSGYIVASVVTGSDSPMFTEMAKWHRQATDTCSQVLLHGSHPYRQSLLHTTTKESHHIRFKRLKQHDPLGKEQSGYL